MLPDISFKKTSTPSDQKKTSNLLLATRLISDCDGLDRPCEKNSDCEQHEHCNDGMCQCIPGFVGCPCRPLSLRVKRRGKLNL